MHVLSKLLGLFRIYDSGISWLHSIWCPEKDKIRPGIGWPSISMVKVMVKLKAWLRLQDFEFY